MNKLTKISIILGSIILIIFASIAIGYWQSVKQNNIPQQISSQFDCDVNEIHLGDKLTFSIIVSTPWHISLEQILPHFKNGISENAECDKSLQSCGFDSFNWKITSYLIPYRTGKLECGFVDIKYNHNNQTKVLSCEIPNINVKALNVESIVPELAQPIVESFSDKINRFIKRYKWILLSSIIVVIALIVGIIYLIVKKRKEIPAPITPPWDVALSAITRLKRKVDEKNILNEICIATLTDIIRVYLEKRFDLHAPTQTTNEFLKDLNRENSPLQEIHKVFLKDFMQSSDFVKFANLPVDKTLINEALTKAKSLVLETRLMEVE